MMFRNEAKDLDDTIGSAVVRLLQARKPVSLPMLLSELESNLNSSTSESVKAKHSYAMDYLLKGSRKQQDSAQSTARNVVLQFAQKIEETS